MEILEKDVHEYQRIYKDKFGEAIDYQSAYQQLTKLVRQMEVVYQPITQEQIDVLRKRDAMAFAELIYDVYEAERQLKEKDG